MKTEQIFMVNQGLHHDPFAVLGFHVEDGKNIIREILPTALRAEVKDIGSMCRIENTDIFELVLEDDAVVTSYEIRWQEQDGSWHQAASPYAFAALIGDLDLYLFNEGKHHNSYEFLGARLTTVNNIEGCQFSLWAPGVLRVSVIGDFNGWHGLRHQMRNRGASGVWELFIPGLTANDSYKFEILTAEKSILIKSDPYARCTGLRPETVSKVPPKSLYVWQDDDWLKQRAADNWQEKPMSIYEVHLGSWRKNNHGEFLTYRELAEQLIPHVQYLGFTHIELLPIAEHPLDESWGYQVSSYYSPSARYGSADDLRFLIDSCHQAGIGVLLDWVPAHFPKDEFALAKLTGRALYEYTDPKKGEHKDWGTLIFDYGRYEVISFLLSNAVYWLKEFHFDGLRVDAVASMLYLDYSRKNGEWSPNEYGGRENLEAIKFLQELNVVIHEKFPGALTMAEESTSWPMVSRPTYIGGLGFSMKWNMGWMNDTLSYFAEDPINRKYHHDKLIFSQLYAYSENFILPLSHDEVVHMKGSLLDKMPGDKWQKFSNLRLLLSCQFLHPGKKLIFMGAEFGQWNEWNESTALNWELNEFAEHSGIGHLLQDLNKLYRTEAALFRHEFESCGFRWIDCHDKDHSILSFYRHTCDENDTPLICLFNFTPVPRYNYQVGVYASGEYREIFNSDSGYYSGSNCGNLGKLQTVDEPWYEFSHTLKVTVPPLGAVVFKID